MLSNLKISNKVNIMDAINLKIIYVEQMMCIPWGMMIALNCLNFGNFDRMEFRAIIHTNKIKNKDKRAPASLPMLR